MAIDTAAGEVEVLDQPTGDDRPPRLRPAADRHRRRRRSGPTCPASTCRSSTACRPSRTPRGCSSLAEQGCRRIVVVGGGYIGLEMAEAFIERGCTATVVERAAPAAAAARRRLRPAGRRGDAGARRRRAQRASPSRASSRGGCSRPTGPLDADLVVLGIGVAPALGAGRGRRDRARGRRRRSRSTTARPRPPRASGRPATAPRPRTSSPAQPAHIALGTYANRHGRVAGINMAGGDARSPPVLGTAITKLCRLEHRLTGLDRAGGRRRRVRRRRRHDRDDDARRLPAGRRAR